MRLCRSKVKKKIGIISMKNQFINKKTITLILGLLIIGVNLPLLASSNLMEKRVSLKDEKSEKITEIINKINQSTVEYYLLELMNVTAKYEDRMTGTDGSRESGKYIFTEFEKIDNNLKLRKETWSGWGDLWQPVWHPGYFSDMNIIAELPGDSSSDWMFVFFVHYDTIIGSPGADDDGSGVAALLTAAKILSQYNFNHTIIFCASSGEEVGDLGDYHDAGEYYKNNTDIAAAITADAIGYMPNINDSRQNSVILYKPERSEWLADIIVDLHNIYNSQIGLGEVKKRSFYGHSGNRAYDDYGFTTLKFFEGITNPGWEKPPHRNDTLDKINFSYLTKVTKLIASTLATLADMPEIYPKINIVSPREDSIYLGSKMINMLHLPKGKTLVLGDIKVETDVESNNVAIQKVFFELIKGDNDLDDSLEQRPILANFTDYDSPYEWIIEERCFGLNTIRATVYDVEGDFTCDDVEVLFFNIY